MIDLLLAGLLSTPAPADIAVRGGRKIVVARNRTWSAGAQHSVVDDRKVGDVGQHDAHAVAALKAPGGQEPGDVRRGAVQHPVAQLDVVELDGDVIGVALRRGGEKVGEVHRGGTTRR